MSTNPTPARARTRRTRKTKKTWSDTATTLGTFLGLFIVGAAAVLGAVLAGSLLGDMATRGWHNNGFFGSNIGAPVISAATPAVNCPDGRTLAPNITNVYCFAPRPEESKPVKTTIKKPAAKRTTQASAVVNRPQPEKPTLTVTDAVRLINASKSCCEIQQEPEPEQRVSPPPPPSAPHTKTVKPTKPCKGRHGFLWLRRCPQ